MFKILRAISLFLFTSSLIGMMSFSVEGEVLSPGISSEKNDQSREPSSDRSDEGLVEVEPSFTRTTRIDGGTLLVPYSDRRSERGGSIGIGVGDYLPIYYLPKFGPDDFYSIYEANETPFLELDYSYKFNFSLGSFGVNLSFGMLVNEASEETLENTLTLFLARVGAVYTMDNLFSEPYVAPYVGGGGYGIYHDESSASSSAKGFTQIAPYFFGGLLFQLNWLDETSARMAYLDHGIENTFLYVEGRKYWASLAERDPDFESEFHLQGGIKFEY